MNLHQAQPIRALCRILTLAIVLLVLGACSMQRLAYQQADWLLLREMDNYLDLREEQRELVATALETHLTRHRVEQLPQFADAFSEASDRAQRGLTEQDARWALVQGRLLLTATAEIMLPTLVSTLADLTPAQRRHLAQRMDERNDEYVDSHALQGTAQQQARRTTERSVESIERWTGKLSDEQIAIVQQVSLSMPAIAADWLAYTRARQNALLQLLDSQASAAAIEEFLRGWWMRRDSLPPQLGDKRDQRLEARIRLIVRLDGTLDSVQREHLVGRLQSLADDARSLLREA